MKQKRFILLGSVLLFINADCIRSPFRYDKSKEVSRPSKLVSFRMSSLSTSTRPDASHHKRQIPYIYRSNYQFVIPNTESKVTHNEEDVENFQTRLPSLHGTSQPRTFNENKPNTKDLLPAFKEEESESDLPSVSDSLFVGPYNSFKPDENVRNKPSQSPLVPLKNISKQEEHEQQIAKKISDDIKEVFASIFKSPCTSIEGNSEDIMLRPVTPFKQ